jgi:hypothetical protein
MHSGIFYPDNRRRKNMENKNLDITNMNGMTNEDDKTCGLNDMNCLGDDAEKDSTCSITNMNCNTEDDDTTCSITDMNCTGDK